MSEHPEISACSRRGQCSGGRLSTETLSYGAIGKRSRHIGASCISQMAFPCAFRLEGSCLAFGASVLLRPGEPRISQLPEAPLIMTLFRWGNRYFAPCCCPPVKPSCPQQSPTHEGILSFLTSGLCLLLNTSLPLNLPYCLNPN